MLSAEITIEDREYVVNLLNAKKVSYNGISWGGAQLTGISSDSILDIIEAMEDHSVNTSGYELTSNGTSVIINVPMIKSMDAHSVEIGSVVLNNVATDDIDNITTALEAYEREGGGGEWHSANPFCIFNYVSGVNINFNLERMTSPEVKVGDDGEWTALTTSTVAVPEPGTNVYLRCKSLQLSSTDVNAPLIDMSSMTDGWMVTGGFDSLLEATHGEMYEECFRNLFRNNTQLEECSAVFPPNSALYKNCMRSMFSSCTALMVVPELPYTELADSCYYYMFDNCKALVTPPTLPAETLVNACYVGMFYRCTALTSVRVAAKNNVALAQFASQFLGTNTKSGVFYKDADVTYPSGVKPSNWTWGVYE